jgi:RNA polymerase sigma-70 factor, ECF subfamily
VARPDTPDLERSLEPSPRDEAEVLARLRAGDEAAFAALVDRHHAAMVRLALTYVRDRTVAEEVAQDAWLGLLRGRDGFEGRSSLRTWLYRIVVNRAISTGVRERMHVPVETSQFEDNNGRFGGNQRVLMHRARARIRALLEQEVLL